MKLPRVGIEGITGLPGSGKSFMAVVEMIEALRAERRPVFTNLPLRWPVVRRYLRVLDGGCGTAAKLLYELDEAHFRRFLERNKQRAEYVGARRHFRDRGQSTRSIEESFLREFGPDVISGPEANWILPGSLVIIDEAHHWFPMERQGQGDLSLKAYVTMHRHHVHWIWWLSQDPMQVSIQFRRNTFKFWQVRNIAQDRLIWGVRWRHVGVAGFGYSSYSADALEGRVKGEDGGPPEPIDNRVILPWLPKWRVYFRLYRSFTHVADAKRLLRGMADARRAVGLREDGLEIGGPDVVEKKEQKMGWKMVAGLLLAGFAFGSATMCRGRPDAAPVASATTPEAAPVAAFVPPEFPAWTAYGGDWVRIGSERLRVGASGGVGRLEAFDPERRVLVLVRDGHVYRWVWGGSCEHLGEVDAVVGAVGAGLSADDGRGYGGFAGSSPGSVEPGAGDGDGTGLPRE